MRVEMGSDAIKFQPKLAQTKKEVQAYNYQILMLIRKEIIPKLHRETKWRMIWKSKTGWRFS